MKWFTQKINVDLETGEILSDSKIQRENWIKKRASKTIENCGAYNLIKITHEYERNNQLKLEF